MSVIYGERIRLRAPEREDIPIFTRWFSDPEVTRGLALYLPFSIAEEENWFDNMIKRPPEEHPLTIEVKEGDEWKPIGNMGLFAFDKVAHNAEVGIVIGEKDYWDQGYGTEAMKLMLKHGFNTLNLHRIMLKVYAYNERAIRTYEKVGYVLEGRLREAIYYNGKYHDILLMGVLRSDWQPED
jgi:RimJ/RimL family protein N-acetyltransferase